MDKETLSNYGWIVICTLVLAVMLALATPFGEFIRDGVWSTTNGLNDTLNKNMEIVGLNGSGDDEDILEGDVSSDNIEDVLGTVIGVRDGASIDHDRKLIAVPPRSNPIDYIVPLYGLQVEMSIGNSDRFIIGDIPNGTGAKLTVYSADKTKVVDEYELIVFGDVDRNGLVNGADTTKINQHLHGTELLTDVAFIAGDTNLDGVITEADVTVIFYHTTGLMYIPADILADKNGDYYPKYNIERDVVTLDAHTAVIDAPTITTIDQLLFKNMLKHRNSLTATLNFFDGTTQQLEFEKSTGEDDRVVWIGKMDKDANLSDTDNIQIGCNYTFDYSTFSAPYSDSQDLIIVNAIDELVNLKSITIDSTTITLERLKAGVVQDDLPICKNPENVKEVVLTFESYRQRKFELTSGSYNDLEKMDYFEIANQELVYYVEGHDYDNLLYITITETIDGVDVSTTYKFNEYVTELTRPW
jgi:hypothetical protein